MKLVNKALEYLFVLLVGVVLELDSAGFDTQRQVLTQTAVLCLHAIGMGGRLLQQEIVVA